MVSVYIKAAAAYLLGFLVALKMPYGFGALFSLCLAVLTFVFRLDFAKKASAVMFFAGVVLMSHAYFPAADAAEELVGRYVEVEGVVCEMPDAHEVGYWSYIIKPSSVDYLGKGYKMRPMLRLTSPMRLDCGNKIRLRGFLDTLSEPDNSTEFDYSLFMRSKGVGYNIYTTEVEITAARAILPSPRYMLEYAKSRVGFAIDRFFSVDDAAFLKAILLGHKSDFSSGMKKLLYNTGAMRFMHPSYLHLYFVTALCEALFAFLPRKKRENIIMLILLGYVIFEGGFAVFVRAVLIYASTVFYRRIRGFSHYPDISFSVATLMLVINPLMIFNPCIVTAFCAGLMIYFFSTPVSMRLRFIRNKELRYNVSVWLCGTIGVMPASAYLFGGTSLYTIIFMLFYTPLVIITVLLAPVVLVIYEIFSGSLLLGRLLDGVLVLIKAIPRITAQLPGCYIMLQRPTPAALAAFFCLAAAVKLRLEGHAYEMRYKVCCGVCGIILCVICVQNLLAYGNLEAYFVNVEQGDGAVISVKGRDKILIDGGGNSNEDSTYNIGENVYLPYLAAKGFCNIDLAIASHYHIDHCEGILAALENLRVGTLMLPDVDEGSEIRRSLESAARDNGVELLYVSAGDRLEFKSGMVMYVLSPYAGKEYEVENDTSLALRIDYRGKSLFFGGDMTQDAERDIAGKVGKCDILKVSHHGSAHSTSDEFFDELSPELAVISVGENNVYSHPAPKTTKRLSEHGARIMRTDKYGDIKLTINRSGKMRAEGFREGD